MRTAAEARKLLRALLASPEASVSWTKHARDEMAKDKLIIPDVINIIRAGVVDEPERENGSWRYRVRTQAITVVVCFDGEPPDEPDGIIVVTAWRNNR